MAQPVAQERRERAMEVYAETGNVSKAAKTVGVDRETVRRWVSRSPETVVQKRVDESIAIAIEHGLANLHDRSEAVVDRLIGTVERSLDEIERVIDEGPTPGEPQAAWLRAVVNALDVATTKALLLNGQPTERTELTGGVDHSHRVFALVEQYGDVISQLNSRSGLEPFPVDQAEVEQPAVERTAGQRTESAPELPALEAPQPHRRPHRVHRSRGRSGT